MVWENCNLTLNSGDSGIFYTGNIVTGSVTLEFKKEQKIKCRQIVAILECAYRRSPRIQRHDKNRDVEFRVIGVSKARWSRVAPTIPYLKVYSEENQLLDTTIDIFSEINGKKVQSGVNNFQFHFTLPSDLPSTFKSSIAKVHYYIEIKCKGAYNRKKVKILPFVVFSHVDLNRQEDSKVPMMFEISKVFTTSGTFSLYFKTYRGFAPKQSLPFEIDINNERKVRISKITVALIQKLEYVVSTGYANEEKKICKIEHSDLSNESKEFCRIFMDVPQVAPSSINVLNTMVNISYVLRVEVIFKFHLTLYEDIPVPISSVPVQHYVS